MTDITDRYLEVCKQKDVAYEAVINVCQHVVLLANILRSTPENVQIAQIPGAIGIANAGLSFDGSHWPTATAINNALADYHTAISAVRTAWINVQARGEQQGLQPPPADPWGTMRTEFLNRANRPPR
jgi:hypothetical protein